MLAALSSQSCPSWPVHVVVSGRTGQADLSVLSFPSCHSPDVLPQLHCHFSATVVPTRLSCHSCPVFALKFWPFCLLFPVLAMLSLLSYHAVLSRRYGPSGPFPAVLPQHSCLQNFCPHSLVLAVILQLSWSICSVLDVRSLRPCPCVLHRL
jgi:hypothetical protein